MLISQKYKQPRRFFLLGLFVFGLVIFLPGADRIEDRYFWEVAFQSSWGILAEWTAAWGSLKIILSGLGGCLVCIALAEYMVVLRHLKLATCCFLFSVLPAGLFLVGLFYLIKGLF